MRPALLVGLICVLAAVCVPAASASPSAGARDDESVAQASGRPAAAGRVAAERRCRRIAKRRFARSERGSKARARARRKLRRCLRQARQGSERAAPPAGGAPPPQEPPTDPGTVPPPASFVGVVASDDDGFRLTLSRPAVDAGTVTIELRNTDSGPHDLAVRPDGGGPVIGQIEPVDPGGVKRKGFALAEGEWRLFCTLDGHEAAGMSAKLIAE